MTSPPPPPRPPLCAGAARERSDPLAGTAVGAQRWLLVEHPGPWAFDALGGSGIDPDVQRELVAAVRSSQARVLLVRRPGSSPDRDERGARAWAVVDTDPTVPQVWGSWRADDDLRAASAALLTAATGHPARAADPVDQRPLLLVCAHGRHDTCCALRGRPVAAAIAQRFPDETWECSHVGGCRFAANLVVLPGGAYYGALDPDDAVGLVERHLAGAVDAAHLRGSSAEPPIVQAAVVAAHARFGPAAADSVRSVGLDAVPGTGWRVQLRGSGPVPRSLVATVVPRRRPPGHLTCRAPVDTSATAYEVVDLQVADPA